MLRFVMSPRSVTAIMWNLESSAQRHCHAMLKLAYSRRPEISRRSPTLGLVRRPHSCLAVCKRKTACGSVMSLVVLSRGRAGITLKSSSPLSQVLFVTIILIVSSCLSLGSTPFLIGKSIVLSVDQPNGIFMPVTRPIA